MTLQFSCFRNKKPIVTKWPDKNGNTYDVIVAEFIDVDPNGSNAVVTYNARSIDRPGKDNANNFLQRLLWRGFNGKLDLSNLKIDNAFMSRTPKDVEFFMMLGHETISI